MFKMSLALMTAAVLAGCVSQKTNEPKNGQSDTCSKAAYNSLIGTQINTAVLPLTLTYRTIYPGQAITMDHAPDRLNIAVDESGVVTGLSCG